MGREAARAYSREVPRMGKSIRSKVKKKFRTIKREALEPAERAKTARIAAKGKEALKSMSLDSKLTPSVLNTNLAMDVDKSRQRLMSPKQIRKKARKPTNAPGHKHKVLKK